jgi:hypothetical protein
MAESTTIIIFQVRNNSFNPGWKPPAPYCEKHAYPDGRIYVIAVKGLKN